MKPTINTKCVASNYQGPNERIAEVSSPSGGCLISTRCDDKTLTVEIYRADPGVRVTLPHSAAPVELTEAERKLAKVKAAAVGMADVVADFQAACEGGSGDDEHDAAVLLARFAEQVMEDLA